MNRKRRSLAIVLSMLLHAGLVAVLLRAPPPPRSLAGVEAIGVSLVDGRSLFAPSHPAPPHHDPEPPRAAQPKPPKPDPPAEIAPQYINLEPPTDDARLDSDPSKDSVAVSVADAASGASGKTCQIGAWLQAALRADPMVQAALARVPRSARSVANAIMIWDARWVPQPPAAVDGVSAIRSALMVGVRAAPAACQGQVVHGPELMILADATGTTVLAMGSGEWRWADLLTNGPTESALETK